MLSKSIRAPACPGVSGVRRMRGDAMVLFIGRDLGLAEAVRESLAGSADRLSLAVVATAEEAGAETLGEFGLVLAHVDEPADLEPLARLLWLSSTLRRPIPVLTLADVFDADRDVSLYRMGVADALSRSHHLDRIGGLIESLYVRQGGGRRVLEP